MPVDRCRDRGLGASDVRVCVRREKVVTENRSSSVYLLRKTDTVPGLGIVARGCVHATRQSLIGSPARLTFLRIIF